MANTKVSSEQIIDDVALGGNPTTTTQSASDNSTKVATTAYVTTAVSNLVDSAPSSLNTLNELAAAMNDNASFFSTVLPLSGGTMTGNIAHASDFTLDVGGDIILDADGGDIVFKDGGTQIAKFSNSSGDFLITTDVDDKDIIFKGQDSTSEITALTLDMSQAGYATFNNGVTLREGLFINNAGNTASIGYLYDDSSDFVVRSYAQDQDLIFKGNDGGSVITALTLDMSAAGAATFNSSITSGGNITVGGTNNLIIGDSGALVCGANNDVVISNTGSVFNEDGQSVDFRIESNDSSNMFVVDGSENKIVVEAQNTASVTDSASMVAASVFEINGNAGEGSDILRFFAMADGTGNYGLEVSNSGGNAHYDLAINPINQGSVFIGGKDAGNAHNYAKSLVIGNTSAARPGMTIQSGQDGEGRIFFADDVSGLPGQIEYYHDGDYFQVYAGASLSFKADSEGIYLGGTGTANRITDYEEGTWTISEVNGQGGTMTGDRVHYTKVGNMVHAWASITVGTTSNNNILNISLPFPSTINGYYLGGGNVSYNNLGTPYNLNLRPNIENAAANVFFFYGDGATAGTAVTCAQASGKRIDFFVSYRV